MPGGFEKDPHSQDGQPCPKNFFQLTSYDELKKLEAVYVGKRALELRLRRMPGKFDIAHLRKIHWFLFRDVFPWAGELRVVGLAKVGGAPFANPLYIPAALDELFTRLRVERNLRNLTEQNFIARGAFFLGEINAIHPFREGNGRTQREFLRQIALKAGHKLSWASLDENRNTAASILSYQQGDLSGLVDVLRVAIADAKKAEPNG